MFSFALSVSLSFAATCPAASDARAIADSDLGADGSAHVLVYDAHVACWWIVEEGGDARLAGRFESDVRRPVRVEALADGRALFVMDDLSLVVRGERGTKAVLPTELSRYPERTLAHPTAPYVAMQFNVDDHTSQIWLVNVNTGEVVAAVALAPSEVAFHFIPERDGIAVDAKLPFYMDKDGVSAIPQSRR